MKKGAPEEVVVVTGGEHKAAAIQMGQIGQMGQAGDGMVTNVSPADT